MPRKKLFSYEHRQIFNTVYMKLAQLSKNFVRDVSSIHI